MGSISSGLGVVEGDRDDEFSDDDIVPQREVDVIGGIGDDPFAVSDASRAAAIRPLFHCPHSLLPLFLPERVSGVEILGSVSRLSRWNF